MVRTRAKGNRNRLKVRKWFEEKGYLIDVVEKTGRFVKQKDLFGLFDLCGTKGTEWVLIQVSTNHNHPHQRYLEFSNNHSSSNMRIIQITLKDRAKGLFYEYSLGENISTSFWE
mgnify:CR=1 FL=1